MDPAELHPLPSVWLLYTGVANALHQVFAVPVDGFFEAVPEGDDGGVADEGLGFGDVGQGVFDVAGARGCVAWGDGVAGHVVNQLNDGIDGDFVAAGDVDHFAAGFRGAGGQQVGVDDVVDVGKVAALLAVAIDGRGLAAEDGR